MQKTAQPQTTSKTNERDASVQISGGGEPTIPVWTLTAEEADILGRLNAGQKLSRDDQAKLREAVTQRLWILHGLLFQDLSEAYRVAMKTAQAEAGKVVEALERLHFS